MESKQMLLLNLFAGQQEDADTEKGFEDTAGEGEGEAN